MQQVRVTTAYTVVNIYGFDLIETQENQIYCIFICNALKDICLNTGFVYHRARFTWVSLDVTSNKNEARKI